MTPELRHRLLAAGALVAGTLVVVVAFNPVPHAGGDNAGYLSLAHGLLVNHAYTDTFDPEGLPHTKYPPVFPALLALLMALGARTWVAFKMTAAASTVLAVGLTYLWAERRLGQVPAFGVAALAAVSSAVVYYSHWILSDPLFVALTMAALVAVESEKERELSTPRLALGVAAALLALFTRSAGLPLVVAILAWLALRRRWRALSVTAVVIGLPGLAWWWRARGGGVASYGAEFWMVDPYQPTLGTIGVLDLIPRAVANVTAYTVSHGPGGIVGQGTEGLGALGVALVVAAAAGWALTAAERVGVAELFFPLYAGLIVLWPEVWAGDRFALPLYPLVFVYGAVALREVGARLAPVAGSAAMAVAFLALILPAGKSWLDGSTQASRCAEIAARDGPFACYGAPVVVFAEAATWAGQGLPDGSVVLSRKPRHFYLLSGVPSRTFPFEDDPAVHLELMDRLGARYVLVDQWDGLASRYVGGAVRRQPDAFCFVRAFGRPDGASAQLLGIRPPGERGVATASRVSGGLRLGTCPDDYVRAGEVAPYAPSSSRIPLLDGLDS